MSYKRWNPEDLYTLQRLYATTPTRELAAQMGRTPDPVTQMARKVGLRKSKEFLRSPETSGPRAGKIDCAGRYLPDHVPANKGLRRPGWAPGRMASTQFPKGHRPANWVPIGTRRTVDGYLQEKVTDTGRTTRDFVPVHVLLWKEHHGGRLPKKKVVVFRDGDKENICIENLEAITRRELMRRNTIHNLPKELVEVIQLTGALKRKIRRRDEKQNVGSTQSPVRRAGRPKRQGTSVGHRASEGDRRRRA